MVSAYLPVFTFAVSGNYLSQWPFAVLTAFLLHLGLLGLLKTAQWMADPFGDGVTDLPVYSFITSTVTGSRLLLVGSSSAAQGRDPDGPRQFNPVGPSAGAYVEANRRASPVVSHWHQD